MMDCNFLWPQVYCVLGGVSVFATVHALVVELQSTYFPKAKMKFGIARGKIAPIPFNEKPIRLAAESDHICERGGILHDTGRQQDCPPDTRDSNTFLSPLLEAA